MRKLATFVLSLTVLLAFSMTDAMAVTVHDLATSIIGSSYNWLRDDDGDGTPNCVDDDYVRPLDGTGYQFRGGDDGSLLYSPAGWQRDDDGDGTPNGQDDDYVPPEDCTGYGRKGGE